MWSVSKQLNLYFNSKKSETFEYLIKFKRNKFWSQIEKFRKKPYKIESSHNWSIQEVSLRLFQLKKYWSTLEVPSTSKPFPLDASNLLKSVTLLSVYSQNSIWQVFLLEQKKHKLKCKMCLFNKYLFIKIIYIPKEKKIFFRNPI